VAQPSSTTGPDTEPRYKTKLQQIRYERDIQQKQLAHKCGISTKTLQRLEQGAVKSPPLGVLVNICIVLGDVALEDLIEDDWLAWQPRKGATRPVSIHDGQQPAARARVRMSWRQIKKRQQTGPVKFVSHGQRIALAAAQADAERARQNAEKGISSRRPDTPRRSRKQVSEWLGPQGSTGRKR
jgi:DNA-binding Xre family transcriptional regulator